MDQPIGSITAGNGTLQLWQTVAAVCRASWSRALRTPAKRSNAFHAVFGLTVAPDSEPAYFEKFTRRS